MTTPRLTHPARLLALGLTLTGVLGLGSISQAAPPSPGLGRPNPTSATGAVVGAKVLRATGVLESIEDGEIILALQLTPTQQAQILKLPGLETGLPATPGRLGVFKGGIYVRYLLAADEDLARASSLLIGKKVAIELDQQRQVTGMTRVP